MRSPETLDPNATYQRLPDGKDPVQLFVSPSQYIQGHGVINYLGEYLSLCLAGRAGVLITPGRDAALSGIISKSLSAAGFAAEKVVFQGESTLEEVKRVVALFEGWGSGICALIGVGGGKCLDPARMAA